MSGDRRTPAPPWALRVNRLKQRLTAGEPALVMWVTIAATEIVEMLGTTPLDAVIIDLEHASYGLAESETLVRACDESAITALVRPPLADETLVARILDLGAYGVVFPMIESARDAEHAVSCMRYRPRGQRGWGGAHTRHARWRATNQPSQTQQTGEESAWSIYSADYVAKAEADLVTILIVESDGGVAAIEDILATEGVDAVLFGWGDLALATGFDWPRVRAAATRVYDACRRANVGYALTCGRDATREFFAGCFYIVGIDSVLISAALSDAVETASRSPAKPR